MKAERLQKIIRYTWVGFGAGLFLFFVFLALIAYDVGGLFGGMPDLEELENPKVNLSSELWSADGKILGKYYRENRTYIPLNQISPHLIKALLATEDIRFYEHAGIDFKATFAIPYYLLKGDRRGSSTITQQLARNLFSSRSNQYRGSLFSISPLRKVLTKMKDWFLTIQIERRYTKNEILNMYFNTVAFGSNSFGIQVACKTFFGKKPIDIVPEEAALLIGLLKAPTRYSPIRNYDNALRRRNTVLSQMAKYQFLNSKDPVENQAILDSLSSLPINLAKFQRESHNRGLAPYFRIQAQRFLFNWCKRNGIDLYGDGIKIYTTIDTKIQTFAENAVEKHLKVYQKKFFQHWKDSVPWRDKNGRQIPNFMERAIKKTKRYKSLVKAYPNDVSQVSKILNTPRKMKVFDWNSKNFEKDTLISPIDSVKYYKYFLQTGMLAMSPYTGYIKAWVGGINHKYFKYDHVKLGKRQPGSTFKPILYATAFSEKEFKPCNMVMDIPTTYRYDDGTTWTPKNSGNKYTGAVISLRQAMARSVNTVAAYLIGQVTPQRVVYYARAKFGIQSPLAAVHSLSLGTSDVSIYELVGAYGVFLNKGTWIEPIFITHIEDKNGKLIHRFVPNTKEALNERVAYMMLDMLKGGTEERGGTSLGLRRYKFLAGNEVGGKTGTTSNYSDAWYVGMTKDLVTGVWVGSEDRSVHFRSLSLGQGSRQAMPIFGYFYDSLYSSKHPIYSKGAFPKPFGNMNYSRDCYNKKLTRQSIDNETL